ncbi:MAG: hypothetical protein ACK5PF_05105, partial [bacterium]
MTGREPWISTNPAAHPQPMVSSRTGARRAPITGGKAPGPGQQSTADLGQVHAGGDPQPAAEGPQHHRHQAREPHRGERPG